MKKIVFKIFPLLILSIFLLSCYTQMKFANQQIEEPAPVYVDEDFYYLDSTQAVVGSQTNIYVYTPPYYYDPWYDPYYDPWYWRPTSRWGWYVSYSFYWGDPYWYPWGWYGRCCYPYVVPYAGYYPPYYWTPHYYYPPYYYHNSKSYAKRPFDRRSPVSPRSVVRGGGRGDNEPAAKEAITRSTRTATRGIATTSGTRGSGDKSSRIVRRDVEGKRLVTRTEGSSRNTIAKRSGSSSSNRSAVKSRSTSRRSSGYKPKSTQRRSSGSSGYNNRRSSNRSSGSYKPKSSSGSSRSSGRSSSGSRSSSSGSSSRSSSGSGSRSTSRK